MPVLFLKKFWHIIGNDVNSFIIDVLNNGLNPSSINSTHIVFIPKYKNPITISDFRFINLCNILFKIITKTIVNRLKKILPNIIHPSQSVFVYGRLITDDTLLAFESFNLINNKIHGQKGICAQKLDMIKLMTV